MQTLLFDLIAERARAANWITHLSKKAAAATSADTRAIYESMLRRYIESMPGIDAQIASLRAAS